MSDHDHHEDGVSRRRVLECMAWAGTGLLWTIAGGVPRSLGIVGSAHAAEPAGMTFLQISDSHVGFDKPAIRIAGTRRKPSTRSTRCRKAGLHHPHRRRQPAVEAHRVRRRRHIIWRPSSPSSTCRASTTSSTKRQALRALRQGREGRRLVFLRPRRRPLRGPRQCAEPQGGRARQSRRDQLDWLEADLRRANSTPIVIFTHIPLWSVYPQWGWGTDDAPRRWTSQALRLGHRAERPHPPGDAEGGGQRHLPHRALDRFSAAGAGHAPSPGPMKVDGRPSSQPARRRQHQLQAGRPTARDHQHAAAGLTRIAKSMSSINRRDFGIAMVAAGVPPCRRRPRGAMSPSTSTISCSSRPNSR